MIPINIHYNMLSEKLFPDMKTRVSDGMIPVMAIAWTVVIKLHIRQTVRSEVK